MYINIGNKPEGQFPEGYKEGLQNFFIANKLPPGRLIYDEVFNSVMFPLQRKNEMREMLIKALLLKPIVVGEIGSDKGGSLYHWCQLPTVRRVLGIEYRGVPYRAEFTRYFKDIDFCHIQGSSYDPDTVRAVKRWLEPDKFDCLFLDGDKANFMQDYICYKNMIRPGGLMFLHDINGEPPEFAFNQISKIHNTERIIDTSEARNLDRGVAPCNSWEEWLHFWGERSCGVGVVYI